MKMISVKMKDNIINKLGSHSGLVDLPMTSQAEDPGFDQRLAPSFPKNMSEITFVYRACKPIAILSSRSTLEPCWHYMPNPLILRGCYCPAVEYI